MAEDIIQISPKPVKPNRISQKLRMRRIVLVLSFVVALAAWAFGLLSNGIDILPLVTKVLPSAERIETRGELFIGYDPNGELVGYAAAGESPGYSGPVEMLVGIDPDGNIIGSHLIAQRESPGFFRLVDSAGLVSQFVGQTIMGDFRLGEDIDAVSGATLSSEGVAGAARNAVRLAAAEGLDTQIAPESRAIKFSWPEVTLIALYAAGYIGHRSRNAGLKRKIRWGTMITGIVVIGFIYTIPFTISQVIAFFSGFWPNWQNNLYWYILLGGILFVTTVDAKNPYCSWFCPFGSFQELLSKVTGAKIYKPRRFREFFTWFQRGLAFTAVVLGLVLRRPGVAGYEPFGTLFGFAGGTIQWIFLLLILITSLIMYRPFCNYLCPIDPFVDLISEIRKWVLEVFKKWRKASV